MCLMPLYPRPANPAGQVRADRAGGALAPKLRPLLRLRRRARREVLQQGGQDLLQGGLLQVRGLVWSGMVWFGLVGCGMI